MNPTVYIYGNPNSVFSSFPEDHTNSFLANLIKKAKTQSQIFIHRNENLLHYCYVRKMESNKVIGFCLCIDCIYVDINGLFSLFDSVYTTMIENGDLIKVESSNRIGWATSSFNKESVAIQEYSKLIYDKLDLTDRNCKTLPKVDFSISINDCIELDIESQGDKILAATERYSNVYVVQQKSEIEKVSSFHSVVRQKDDEIGRLNEVINKKETEINKLKEEKSKINRQKKQFQYVVFLLVVVVGCGIGLFFLNDLPSVFG